MKVKSTFSDHEQKNKKLKKFIGKTIRKMKIIMIIKKKIKKSLVGRWYHKLFKCPTFWHKDKWYTCPRCGKILKCYWDGNDVSGHGIDYCNKCTKILEK